MTLPGPSRSASQKRGYACAVVMSLATGCVAVERVDDVAPTEPATAHPPKAGLSSDTGAVLAEIDYVQIPAGTFTMGSPSDEEGREDDEGPQHEVSISAFELGKYEVTNAQYVQFLDAHPHVARPQNWNYWLPSDEPTSIADWGAIPVTGMTWDEAALFAMWVGARLPTEAEWEYAARAGTTGSRYGELDDVAWYDGDSSGIQHAVGTKQGNTWGIHDMLGNVYEWCSDKYALYDALPASDPTGASQGTLHVLRSGSFADQKSFARAAYRLVREPAHRSGDFGFRVVRLEAQKR